MKKIVASLISIASLLLQLSVATQSAAFTAVVDDQVMILAASKNPAKRDMGSISPEIWDVEADGKLLDQLVSVMDSVKQEVMLSSTRGAKEISLYQKISETVVIVVTDDGLGSGVIINAEGDVLTNWHVVKAYAEAVVVLKPRDSVEVKKEMAFVAKVVKVDQVADLALLKVVAPPTTLPAVELGQASTLNVGQDVHAIGHPEGQVWTYTKGIISQVRPGYGWQGVGTEHRAKVIQTQTPINPGNSGGPLLDDSGRLIGINSFRAKGEGLNYAVAIDAIQEFLSRKENRLAKAVGAKSQPNCTEGYALSGKGRKDIWGCYSGKVSPPPDYWVVHRPDPEIPDYMVKDSQRKGRIDTVSVHAQKDRTLVWFFDRNCDGVIDLIGLQKLTSSEIDSFRIPEKRYLIAVRNKAWNS
jgi:S1-C subfamily serine protease